MVKILSSGIPILNIEDLPKSEFRISINRKIITNLINNVKLKSNELYKKFCSEIRLRPLTQRRVSDIISELDMLGIINGKVVSNGRYGRTRKITLAIQNTTKTKARETLEKSLGFSK